MRRGGTTPAPSGDGRWGAGALRWARALRQAIAPQQFAFRPLQMRCARLRVLSRHGEAGTVALGAFALSTPEADQSPLLSGP